MRNGQTDGGERKFGESGKYAGMGEVRVGQNGKYADRGGNGLEEGVEELFGVGFAAVNGVRFPAREEGGTGGTLVETEKPKSLGALGRF